MRKNSWTKCIAGVLLIVCLMLGTACGGNEENASADGGGNGGQTAAQSQEPQQSQQSQKSQKAQEPQKAQIAPAQAEKETAAGLLQVLSAAEDIGPGYEWSLMAIARSSLANTPEAQALFLQYQENLRVLVKRTKGVLDEDRPTDNAKAAIALHMMGADPTDVEGIDLLTRLDDRDAVEEQGINAQIWALTASSLCERKLEHEDQYIKDICGMQGKGGGITYDGVTEDVDITAMAIQALAPYADKKKVIRETLNGARAWLAAGQDADGSYGNAESTAQVILALSSLQEDPESAEDFDRDGITLYDGLMRYCVKDGFCHVTEAAEADPMATEQSVCALDAIVLAKVGAGFFQ